MKIMYPLIKTTLICGSGYALYRMTEKVYAIVSVPGDKAVKLRFTVWLTNFVNRTFRAVRFYLVYLLRRLVGLKVDVKWRSLMIDSNITRYGDLRALLEHPISTIPIRKPAKTHTHGPAATLRSGVDQVLTQVVYDSGYTPYHVSRAKNDIGDGNRYFYFVKDLKQNFVHTEITDRHVAVMIDVDFYVDMPEFLKQGRPVVMYTLSPEYAAYKDDQCSYTIKSNQVVYNVSGGAQYKHEIWDYDHDTITVIDDAWSLIVYDVTQKKIDGDPNRRLIFLTPSAKVLWPYYLGMELQQLKRKVYSYGPTNIVRNRVDGKVSIAKSGSYIPLQLSEEDYEAIRIRVGYKGDKAVISDVETILNKIKYDKAYSYAPVLFDMIRDVSEIENQITTVATKVTTITFQMLGSLVTEDANEVGQAFSSPIVTNPSLFAGKTANNDEATIKGRVDSVRNDITPPKSYFLYATEFVNLLVGDKKGTGVPWEAADVIAVQDKAQQKARASRVAATMSTKPDCSLTCFIKTEPYPSLNDPRNITTCSPEFTIQMSRYSYAEKEDVLKSRNWYGPCKTPDEVLDQLQKVCSNATQVIETDYSRFDGTISQFLQNHVAKASAMAWCRDEDKEALEFLYSKLFTKKAITSTGLRFDPGWGTRSGSPITSDGNTKINAYITYVAHREMGAAPAVAWSRLDDAIFCGDDGLQVAYPGFAEMVESVSGKLGLKLKAMVKTLGEDIIGYCGRLFPDPKVDRTSCQDILRTITKLHLSANSGATPGQAAMNKAMGYWVTDRHTPIISTWAERILEICESIGVTEVKGCTGEELYKLAQAWPQPNPDGLRDVVCKTLEITGNELDRVEQALREAKTFMDFPVVYDNPRTDRVTAIVGHDIRGPTIENNSTTCQESKSIASNMPAAISNSANKPVTQSGNKSKHSSPNPSKPVKKDANSVSKPPGQTKIKSSNSRRKSRKNSQKAQGSCPTANPQPSTTTPTATPTTSTSTTTCE